MPKALAYFVHIPKTAGNSLRQRLRSYGVLANPAYTKKEREHSFGYKEASRVLHSHLSFKTPHFPCYLDDEKYHNSLVKFTCIRNPFDLLSSYYHHYIDHSKSKNYIDHGWANVNGYHKFNSFYQFIDIYCNSDPEEWHVPPLSRCLYEQIFNDKGISNLDFAIRYEHLKSGIDTIYKIVQSKTFFKLSIPMRLNYFMQHLKLKKLKTINKSTNSKELYTVKMVKMVEKKCEWELKTFSYRYNKIPQDIIINIKDLERYKIK
jgi:hypothetical protein